MNRAELLQWLTETDPERLGWLWGQADAVRRQQVGDEVHLRGLLETSSHCVRHCLYCGLRAPNRDLPRYRMTAEEILAGARLATDLGYGTVVLQSGEDPGLTEDFVAGIIRRIKAETRLAVTLSLGERSVEELAAWRAEGADRYLLRFETSNAQLYAAVHPSLPGRPSDRIALLGQLRELGYEIGSGVMIGIPGQTFEDLADDLEWFARLDLDMIGVGPFIPHPATPLGQEAGRFQVCNQVPNDEEMTCKVMALARRICPAANIPATTALATLNRRNGMELGLTRGGNVVMPNLTPAVYRSRYDIYPEKACIQEAQPKCLDGFEHGIIRLGRRIGQGRGDSANYLRRRTAASRKT
jgi:biotin synthase